MSKYYEKSFKFPLFSKNHPVFVQPLTLACVCISAGNDRIIQQPLPSTKGDDAVEQENYKNDDADSNHENDVMVIVLDYPAAHVIN